MDLSMYTAGLSAALLLVLIAVYFRMYRDTKAQFSVGLTIFAVVLFVQNVLAVYSFLARGSYVLDQFLPFLLSTNLAELVGITVLLRTATR